MTSCLSLVVPVLPIFFVINRFRYRNAHSKHPSGFELPTIYGYHHDFASADGQAAGGVTSSAQRTVTTGRRRAAGSCGAAGKRGAGIEARGRNGQPCLPGWAKQRLQRHPFEKRYSEKRGPVKPAASLKKFKNLKLSLINERSYKITRTYKLLASEDRNVVGYTYLSFHRFQSHPSISPMHKLKPI